MFRLTAFVALNVALVFAAVGPTRAGQYGTPQEAKALLEKAVVAVKEDKARSVLKEPRCKSPGVDGIYDESGQSAISDSDQTPFGHEVSRAFFIGSAKIA